MVIVGLTITKLCYDFINSEALYEEIQVWLPIGMLHLNLVPSSQILVLQGKTGFHVK